MGQNRTQLKIKSRVGSLFLEDVFVLTRCCTALYYGYSLFVFYLFIYFWNKGGLLSLISHLTTAWSLGLGNLFFFEYTQQPPLFLHRQPKSLFHLAKLSQTRFFSRVEHNFFFTSQCIHEALPKQLL